MITPYLTINGILCLAALVAAGFHSKMALKCAAAFAVGWLICTWTWVPDYAPQVTLRKHFGLDAQAMHIWAIADSLVGAYILEKTKGLWWGIVLFGLYWVQCGLHVVNLSDLSDFGVYSLWLDRIYILQASVFLFIGWPNVRNRVLDCINRRWDVYNPRRAAQARIRAMEEKR